MRSGAVQAIRAGALLLMTSGLLAGVFLPVDVAQAASLERADLHPAEPDRAVVVIGIAGLRWADVDARTPALEALTRSGAVGALSVKAGPAVTCPADGWLTLGAGARASADVDREPCAPDLPTPTERDRSRNRDSTDEARLGLLADALGGIATEGPGAALVGPDNPAARVRVVDGGSSGTPAELADADAVVARWSRTDADLLVVGLSEDPGGRTAHLHLALVAGPDIARGSLRSPSTRRDGIVQLIDVAPTVLALAGHAVPAEMDGQPWQISGSARGLAGLRDLDERAVVGKRATVPFVTTLVAIVVLVAALARTRPAVVRAVGLGGLATLGGSYAAMLVPWWRAPAAPLVLILVSAAIGGVVTAVALRTRWPVAAVCGAVWLLLVADLLTGAHLQLESPAGYSSLVAGRFAGIGNVAFGVYGTCALLLATALAAARPPRRAGLTVIVVGLLAVAVDGAPPWGSDVGGVLALLPAFVLLGLLLTGTRVTPVRLLLALVAAALLVTVFALLDYARPTSSRTHLGRFVAQVRDGTAGDVLHRKAQAIVDLLFANAVTALLPLVVAGAVWLFLRPPAPLAQAFAAQPPVRQALLAVGLLAGLGFVLNDSGPAVVALALLVTGLVGMAVLAGARLVVASPGEQLDGVAAGRTATPDP